MRAGRLRHRVTLQSKSESLDGFGEPARTWSNDATVYAAIEPLSGRERLTADQVRADVSHRILIRHRDNVSPANRITHSSRTFEIISVSNFDERDIRLELLCTEVV